MVIIKQFKSASTTNRAGFNGCNFTHIVDPIWPEHVAYPTDHLCKSEGGNRLGA